MLTAIDNFLKYLKLVKKYSEHTVSAYQADLFHFIKYLTGKEVIDLPLSDFNRHNLKNYLRSLIMKKDSKKTYNRHLAAIKSFSKYLLKHRLINSDVSINLHSLTLEQHLPKFVPKVDMLKIIDGLSNEDFLHCRANLIIELFYDTGIRLSELVSLKIGDFNLFERMLCIIGKGRKQRIIPFSLHLPPKIDQYLVMRNEVLKANSCENAYLFISSKGGHLSNRQVQRIVESYLKKVATLTQTSPHVLRHSLATHMLDSGADIGSVQSMLGHESLSSTQVYTHLSIEKIKSVYKKSHPKGE